MFARVFVAAGVLLSASFYSAGSFAASQSEFRGRVVNVADGDTLTVLTKSKERVRVRLSEIDAPEMGQPFGRRSKQSLSSLCSNATAQVRREDTDRYGRVIGRVICRGVDTNAEQVRLGLAWVYDSYVKERSFYRLQEAAREQGLGLWSEPNPVAPWDWRRGERGDAAGAGAVVQGNRNSKIYHVPGCPSYGAMSKKNVVEFSDEAAAKAAGFRKAGNCR